MTSNLMRASSYLIMKKKSILYRIVKSMMPNISQLMFLFIGLLLSINGFAQESQKDTLSISLKKNVVHGTIGAYAMWNVNYERMIGRSENKLVSYWLRTGYGLYETWGSSGTNFLIEFTTLFWPGSSHLEASIGFTSLFNKTGYDFDLKNGVAPEKSSYRDSSVAGAFGYRFQKSDGNFLFRSGIGYPETFYLSFGFLFGRSR